MTYTTEQADRWDKINLGILGARYKRRGQRMDALIAERTQMEQNLAALRAEKERLEEQEDDVTDIQKQINQAAAELAKHEQKISQAPTRDKQLAEYLKVRQRAVFPSLESSAEETQPVSSRKLLQIPTGSNVITFSGEGRKELMIGGV